MMTIRNQTVTLSREDEEIIRKHGIDREKFIEARARQLAEGRLAAGRPQTKASSGFLTPEDEEIIRKNGLDREKFLVARGLQIAQGRT